MAKTKKTDKEEKSIQAESELSVSSVSISEDSAHVSSLNPVDEQVNILTTQASPSVNWRDRIKPEYLVLKKELREEIESVYGKPLEELSVNDVDDKYLLILLDGIKEVAKERGFKSVKYHCNAALPDFVSVTCEIEWIGTPETNGESVVFSDGADATPQNTPDWYGDYLTTAAYNRAFVRAVRNFLGIYIVGKDEIGPTSRQSSSKREDEFNGVGPHAALQDCLKKKNRSFDELKKFLVKKGGYDQDLVDEWETIKDIPKDRVFNIMGLINKNVKE